MIYKMGEKENQSFTLLQITRDSTKARNVSSHALLKRYHQKKNESIENGPKGKECIVAKTEKLSSQKLPYIRKEKKHTKFNIWNQMKHETFCDLWKRWTRKSAASAQSPRCVRLANTVCVHGQSHALMHEILAFDTAVCGQTAMSTIDVSTAPHGQANAEKTKSP